jgi:hypothetical protein
MAALNSHSEQVSMIKDGHLLRWIKQMALRGRSRDFDDNGTCGTQKLVLTGDAVLFMEHRHRVFPGAKFTKENAPGRKQKRLEQLIDVLRRPGLPSCVSTSEIGTLLGVRWGKVSKDLVKHKSFRPLLEAEGWEYQGKAGPRGGCFVRTASVAEAVNLPETAVAPKSEEVA